MMMQKEDLEPCTLLSFTESETNLIFTTMKPVPGLHNFVF